MALMDTNPAHHVTAVPGREGAPLALTASPRKTGINLLNMRPDSCTAPPGVCSQATIFEV